MKPFLTKRLIGSVTLTTAFLLHVFCISNAAAEIRTLTATGEYRMGDNDTRTDAKHLALLDAKRLALEQAGVYIESTTEVKNLDLTKEEIRAYTAGIVEVIEQNTRTVMEGDSTVIRVDVTAKIDTDVVTRQIDALRKNESGKTELLRLRVETERLRQDLNAQSRELALLKAKTQIEEATTQRQQLIKKAFVNEFIEKAVAAYGELLFAYFNEERNKSEFVPSVIETLTRMRNLTEQALSLDPSNPEANGLMVRVLSHEGYYLVEKGSYDNAILKFREAVRLRPNDANVHAAFARALDKMGKLDVALVEARTAINLEPAVAMHYVGLGYIFWSKRDFESAIATFRKAISLDASNGNAHLGLSLVLRSIGNRQEGDQEFKRGTRLLLGEKYDEWEAEMHKQRLKAQ